MTHQEPLDLGATELSEAGEARIRREHDLDRPQVFDQRNDVDRRSRTRANLLPEELRTGSADSGTSIRTSESAPDTAAERRESGA